MQYRYTTELIESIVEIKALIAYHLNTLAKNHMADFIKRNG